MLPYIIAGLVTGSVYGLIGTSLVLTYKTSGVFNFATGALATVAAYIYYFLHVQQGVPVVVALVLSVPVLGAVLALGMERLANGLTGGSVAHQVAATIGLLFVVESVGALLYGENPLKIPSFLPTSTFQVAGVFVGYDQLITFVVSVAAVVLLYIFLRATRNGKAMQAVVENPNLLALAGTNPVRVRRLAWTIGCFLVALSGLLLAPSVGIAPTNLTLLVVQGFGAAAIGAFTNLYGAWAGGLAIGVVASVLTKYVGSSSILAGLPPSIPFIAVFVTLLFQRRSRLTGFATARTRSIAPTWKMPSVYQLAFGAVVLAFLLLVPALVGFHVTGWTTSLIYVMMLLSLGLLVRTSGQVSLCQITFAAIGVVAFSKLTTGAGLPWLPALLLSGLVAVPIGALMAVPAIRLAGVYLAVATFGFGLLVQNMFYQTHVMFGGTDLGILVPAPSIPGLGLSADNLLYYVVLAITVVVAVLVVVLTRTRLGRLLQGLSDSPRGLAGVGVNVTVVRVLVFCLSAYIAALAGGLLGALQTQASGLSYDPNMSLLLLVLVVIVFGSEPWYALVGAIGLGVIPTYISGTDVTYYLQLVFGASAVLVSVQSPPQLPVTWRRRLERVGTFPRRRKKRAPTPAPSAILRPLPRDAGPTAALQVSDLRVQFGGLVAVDGASLAASNGSITGLIGPNGAGKTTLFNACTGLASPNSGNVFLNGRDISRVSPSQRARLGLGRTFQEMQLFDTLSVATNVAIGREAAFAGANPLRQVIDTPTERRAIDVAVQEALVLCDLEALAGEIAGDLSTGQRRLVEMARCFAGEYEMVLLDEPSAGLDRAETRRVGEILQRVVDTRRTGILLVEHDMELVMDLCRYIYVLDFGQIIFEGTPDDVRGSATVQAAYLGSEALERKTVPE